MAVQTAKKTSRKMFFSMGEVAEMFDVNASLIRFWEKRFDVLKPKKNAKGNRLFTPQDIENLKLIYHLVKEKGMTLSGAEKYLKDNKHTLERDVQIMEHLQHIRSVLLDIKDELGSESTDTQIVVKNQILAEVINETIEIGIIEEPTGPETEAMAGTEVLPSLFEAPETAVTVTSPQETTSMPSEIPVTEEPEKPAEPKPRYIEPTLFDF